MCGDIPKGWRLSQGRLKSSQHASGMQQNTSLKRPSVREHFLFWWDCAWARLRCVYILDCVIPLWTSLENASSKGGQRHVALVDRSLAREESVLVNVLITLTLHWKEGIFRVWPCSPHWMCELETVCMLPELRRPRFAEVVVKTKTMNCINLTESSFMCSISSLVFWLCTYRQNSVQLSQDAVNLLLEDPFVLPLLESTQSCVKK